MLDRGRGQTRLFYLLQSNYCSCPSVPSVPTLQTVAADHRCNKVHGELLSGLRPVHDLPPLALLHRLPSARCCAPGCLVVARHLRPRRCCCVRPQWPHRLLPLPLLHAPQRRSGRCWLNRGRDWPGPETAAPAAATTLLQRPGAPAVCEAQTHASDSTWQHLARTFCAPCCCSYPAAPAPAPATAAAARRRSAKSLKVHLREAARGFINIGAQRTADGAMSPQASQQGLRSVRQRPRCRPGAPFAAARRGCGSPLARGLR